MFLIDRSRWWTPRLRVRGALRRHPRRCRRPQPPDAGQCRFVARYHIYELIFWKILLADVENQCIQARKLATKMLEISCWIFLCFPRVWYFFPLFRTVDPAAEAGRPDGGAGGSRDGQPAVGADRQEGWRLVRPDSPDGCHLCALNRQKELVVSAQPLSELNLILPHLFFAPRNRIAFDWFSECWVCTSHPLDRVASDMEELERFILEWLHNTDF